MKKIIYFFSFIFMFFALQSCDEQLEIIDADSSKNELLKPEKDKGLDYEIVSSAPSDLCNEETYNLVAGQYIDAGDVTVGNDNTYLYITVYSEAKFKGEENVKMWIGTCLTELPTTGNGTPIPGQFPIKETVDGNEIIFQILLEDIDCVDCGDVGEDSESVGECWDCGNINVVVHADVKVIRDDGTEGSETAWGCEDCVVDGDKLDCGFVQGERWWCAIEYTPECCDDCMDAFAFKINTPEHYTCFLDDGFAQWGWTNEVYHSYLVKYPTYPYNDHNFQIPLYAKADQCDVTTENGAIYIGYVELEGIWENEFGDYDTNSGSLVLFANIKYVVENPDYVLSEVSFYIDTHNKYPKDSDDNPTVSPVEYNYQAIVNGTEYEFPKIDWPGIDKWDWVNFIAYAKVCRAE